MYRNRRYKDIGKMTVKRLLIFGIILAVLTGCAGNSASSGSSAGEGSYIDFQKLKAENSDIFGWIYVPGTDINYPLLQSGDGNDSFYATHNAAKEEAYGEAAYIESANLSDMCDFNEVVHGISSAQLGQFMDRTYFETHDYIYVYMEGNVLVYYIMAAYNRENTRLLEQYDFSYAEGCQEFIDEIYSGKSMNKNIRSGWESGLTPEHFLITLTAGGTDGADRQIVVIGCLVGDAAGKIDRVVDWSDPDDE